MNQNEKRDLPQRSNNREKTINQITSESARDLFVLCKKNFISKFIMQNIHNKIKFG